MPRKEACLFCHRGLTPISDFPHLAKRNISFIIQLNFQVPQIVPALLEERSGQDIWLHGAVVQTGDLGVKCNLSFHASQSKGGQGGGFHFPRKYA